MAAEEVGGVTPGVNSASPDGLARISSKPMPPLEGCLAKIARAESHLTELKVRVRQYIDTQPFRVFGEYDEATHEYVIRAEAVPDYHPVPIDLVLLAGEVVHQLRSALDHLVWDLVVKNTGLPPAGTDSGYPIFRTAEGYSQRAPKKVKGVSQSAADRIRALQPFHLGDHAEEELTWAVQELNNTDKHRLIPVAVVYAFVGAVHMTVGDGPPKEILPWQEFVREPMVDGMEIARVPVPDGDQATFNVPVGADIAFVEVGALRHHPVTDLLVKATRHVRGLVEGFEPEFAVAGPGAG